MRAVFPGVLLESFHHVLNLTITCLFFGFYMLLDIVACLWILPPLLCDHLIFLEALGYLADSVFVSL